VLYALFIHDTPATEEERKARLAAHPAAAHGHADPTPPDEWNHNHHDNGPEENADH